MSPSHTCFFYCNMKNTSYRTDTTYNTTYNTLLILLTIQYFLTLQFILYFLQFFFFGLHSFFFASQTVLIPNISPIQYIHFFFYLQIITYLAYSTAPTLLTLRYFTYVYSRGFLGFIYIIPWSLYHEKISAVWLARAVMLIFSVISLNF